MDDVLQRLNAFLEPIGSARSSSSEHRDDSLADRKSETVLLQATKHLDPDQAFDIIIAEVNGLEHVLGLIKTEYDNFVSLYENNTSLAGSRLLPLCGKGAPCETSPSLDCSPNVEIHANSFAFQDAAKEVTQHSELRSVLHLRLPKITNFTLGKTGIDWAQVHKCARSQSLQGSLEVVGVYTRAFQSVVEEIGESRPIQARQLLQVWGGYLQLISNVVTNVKREKFSDKRLSNIQAATKALGERCQVAKERFANTIKDVEAKECTKSDLDSRVSTLEEQLSEMTRLERTLLDEQVEVERRLCVVMDALNAEKYEVDLATQAAPVDSVPQLNSTDKGEQRMPSLQPTPSAVSVMENMKLAMNAEDSFSRPAAPQRQGRRRSVDVPNFERALSMTTIVNVAPENTVSTLGSPLEDDELMQDAAEAELVQLSREIRTVERAAIRKREQRQRAREMLRMRQMVKVSEVMELRKVLSEVMLLKEQVEKQCALNQVLVVDSATLRKCTWKTIDGEEIKLSKLSRKKKKKKGNRKSKEAGPGVVYQIFPFAMLRLFQKPVDEIEAIVKRCNLAWSLSSLSRIIAQVYQSLFNLPVERKAPETLCRVLYSLFLDDYSSVEEAETGLIEFWVSISQLQTTHLTAEVFATVSASVDGEFNQFYSALKELENFEFLIAEDGTRWVDVKVAQSALKAAMPCDEALEQGLEDINCLVEATMQSVSLVSRDAAMMVIIEACQAVPLLATSEPS